MLYKSIFLIIVSILLLGACSTHKKQNKNERMNPYDFNKAWEKVENLEKQGLAKTVYLKVLEIHGEAIALNKSEQLIKSLIYKGKYYTQVEEDGMIKTIEDFEKSLGKLSGPDKAIAQSLLAELYDHYLMQNLWKINQRTDLSGHIENDIRNWPARQFVDRSAELFIESVSLDELKSTSINKYPELIKKPDNDKLLRSTLYDLLAHRAIDYFKEKKVFLSQGPDRYILKEESLFSDVKSFSKLNFSNPVGSREMEVLKLFRDLSAWHLKKNNEKELLDLDIHRLNFVKANFISAKTDQLYENALRRDIEHNKHLPGSAELSYYLAEHYQRQHNKNYNATDQSENLIKRAHAICKKAIKDHPKSYGADLCAGLLSRMEDKSLRILTEQVNLPGEKLICRIEYKNVEKVYFRLVEIDQEKFIELSDLGQKEMDRFVSSLAIMDEWGQDLPGSGDLIQYSTEIAFTAPDKGSYLLLASNHPSFDPDKGTLQISSFFVSELAFWHTRVGNENYIYVVNRKSGEPIPGVGIKLYEWEYSNRERKRVHSKSLISNEQGFAVFKNEGKRRSNYMVELQTEDERLFFDNSLYIGNYNDQKRVNDRVLYFLDRSVYRPGQRVYFKGILIEENSKELPRIIQHEKDIHVTLYDVNHQKAGEISVSSNEYGSFSGSFVLPSSGLTGQMSIGSDASRDKSFFRVEEYKRPQFKVELKNYEKSYALGDKIMLEGEALSYAGVSISNAKLVYRVMRKSYFPYWSYIMRINPFNTREIEIANGTGSTDDQGKFQVPVELLADDLIPQKYKPYFRYEISVDVVDDSGETHSDSHVMHASRLSKNVSLNLPEKNHSKDSLKLDIVSKNWSGLNIPFEGVLEISLLESPDRVYRQRFWSKPDIWIYDEEEFKHFLPNYSYQNQDDPSTWRVLKKIREEKVDSKINAQPAFKLARGTYRVKLLFEDSGEEVSLVKYVSVYDDEHLPAQENFILNVEGGEPGSDAKIDFQGDSKGLTILYELFEKENRTQHEWKKLNSKHSLQVPILEKHRGNFFVRATFVHNNRIHTEMRTIEVPWTNKELNIEYSTFRSVLEPGQKEKWTVKITGINKDLVMSEMLASMYDASLDDIKKHAWNASIYRNSYLNSSVHYFGFGQGRIRSFTDRKWNVYYYPKKTKTYSNINWFGFERIPGFSVFREDVGLVEMAAPRTMEKMKSRRVANGEMDEAIPTAAGVQSEASYDAITIEDNGGGNLGELDGGKERDLAPQHIRSNLDETVFFYPHLKTDEEGNVLIEFTMNEALTSWKFMAMAHSKDLKIGLSEKEIMTQKELMIQANAPRFVRQGDELVFSASLSNLSEEALSGKAVLQLYDANGLKEITSTFMQDNEQSFELKKGDKQSSKWRLRIPEDFNDLILFKVWARSGDFSDGEESYLPVLSNRRLVTESMPIWVGANESKSYRFEALEKMGDKKLESHSFTIEASSHPIWYAIQALPYISDYKNSNSISLVNALYSNLLAEKISSDNPIIEKVFRQWKEAEKTGDGKFGSMLEKNQELKNILLRESPWLLDAMDESRQMNEIAQLFEVNQLSQDKKQLIQLLKSLQQYDGGFSWFNGGKSSEVVTLYVLEILGKLQQLGIPVLEEPGMKKVLEDALLFADESISKRYRKLSENIKDDSVLKDKDHLGRRDIYYLYIRSIFKDIDYRSNAREASVFFLNQMEKYWLDKNIYLQGMMALTLHNRGNSNVSRNILRSLEERSIFKEELGRYWKHHHGYHWAELPIETQALLIEAFSRIYEQDELVQQMQFWLLKNKQTNRWHTARASVAAIQALLIENGQSLQQTSLVELTLGKEKIDPDGADITPEAGTGYFKKSYSAQEINEDFKDIVIENPNEGIAWGAAYWQYFQDLDRIKSFTDTPVKVNRELFLTTLGKNGEELKLLSSRDALKQGDKVMVRIRIEVDRAMEYMHLSDQRGAALENIEQISKYNWNGGLFYYMSPKDSGTDIFIEHLPRGVYVIEYPLRAVHSGEFSGGIATLQSMYAPEFSSHSEGVSIQVR